MMASAKAGDAVYGITLPATARLLRELQYNIFYVTDHTTHFYALAAPDFVMGPRSDPGPAQPDRHHPQARPRDRRPGHPVPAVGPRGGGRSSAAGRCSPINAIPGGMSKGLSADERDRLDEIVRFMVEFAKATLGLFREGRPGERRVRGPDPERPLHPRDLLDGPRGRAEPRQLLRRHGCGSWTRTGRSSSSTRPRDYAKHVAERGRAVDLPQVPVPARGGLEGLRGRQGLRRLPRDPRGAAQRLRRDVDAARPGGLRGVLRDPHRRPHGPHARPPHARHPLGAASWRCCTPRSGRRSSSATPRSPTPSTTASCPPRPRTRGSGIVEAPRGTLTHHYVTDEKGILKKVNLIVGTTNNHAAICMSIKKAAQGVIHAGASP